MRRRFRTISLSVVVLAVFLLHPLAHAQSSEIGSGHPGMKIALRSSSAIAIYEDEPETVGVGLRGGMRDRHLVVLLDHGYSFNQKAMDIPEQLYPLASDSAFTCSGGAWNFDTRRWDQTKRKAIGYRLVNGQLTVIPDALSKAALNYKLKPNESFLGRIDGRIFFWRDYLPRTLFWREIETSRVYSIELPKGIIDIYGVTRGVRKDIALVVFRKSPGLIHIAPNMHDVLEFSLVKGKREYDQQP